MRKIILWLSAALVFLVTSSFIPQPKKNQPVYTKPPCPLLFTFQNNTSSYTVPLIWIDDGVTNDSDANIPAGTPPPTGSATINYSGGTAIVNLEVHLSSGAPAGRIRFYKNGSFLDCKNVSHLHISQIIWAVDTSPSCDDVYTAYYDEGQSCP